MVAKGETIKREREKEREAARGREGPNTGPLFAWPRFSSSSITQKALARKCFQAFSFLSTVLYLSFHHCRSLSKLLDSRHVILLSSYHPLFRQRLVTSHPHVFKIVVETKFAISVVFRRLAFALRSSQDLVTRAAGRFHSLVIFSTRSRCLSHTLPFSSVLLHANAANGKRGMANGNGKRMNATSRRRRRRRCR